MLILMALIIRRESLEPKYVVQYFLVTQHVQHLVIPYVSFSI